VRLGTLGCRFFWKGRRRPSLPCRRDVLSQEGYSERAGLDVVKAGLDVVKECGDPNPRSLQGSDFMIEEHASVKSSEAGEGAALVGVEEAPGAG